MGKPLASSLLKSGFEVQATTRGTSGSVVPSGVAHHCFDVAHLDKSPLDFLSSDDILIYSIPPLALPIIQDFFSQVHPDQHIIFISSTSVYGKNRGAVDEKTEFVLTIGLATGSAQLIATEAYLQTRFKNLTILRPGGLYGEKRHPIFFLQGKKDLMSGKEFAHLVHQEDCIKAITAVIELNCWGEIFNLVSDLQMLKKDYYQSMAIKLNLTPPEYCDAEINDPTRISNVYSKKKIIISYRDPLKFVI